MRWAGGISAAVLAMVTAATAAGEPAPRPDRGSLLADQIAAIEQRDGRAAPELLPLLGRLAHVRFEQAELGEATRLRRRALSIAISAYGNRSAAAAKAMTALARLYVQQHRYLDAEPLAIAAFGILVERPGGPAPTLASALAERARIALAIGEHDCARRWAEQAVAIDRKTSGAAQSERLRVLGAVLAAEAKFDAAQAVLGRAIVLDRGAADDLALARSLIALARAELRQKRFAAALPAIEEATAIDQRRLAPHHLFIAENFHDLGVAYLGLGRAAEAATALRMAVATLERDRGRETPALAYVQLDLARAEQALGHDKAAQALFAAARRILNAAEDEERDRQRRT